MDRTIKWAAELVDVEEASVLGVADLAYWKDRLGQSDLVPAEREGKAQILIIAGAGRFAGVRFRELSFSVLVARSGQGPGRGAAYLIQAINSCRLFAFCERTFFSTPYSHGDVRLTGLHPAAIELAQNGRVVFRVQMQKASLAESREPSSCGEDAWEGAIFLPDQHKQDASSRKMFFARIRGYTKRYPFLRDRDLLQIEPSSETSVLQALMDSHFVPAEWVLREKATHAKSKTYKRGEVLAAASHS